MLPARENPDTLIVSWPAAVEVPPWVPLTRRVPEMVTPGTPTRETEPEMSMLRAVAVPPMVALTPVMSRPRRARVAGAVVEEGRTLADEDRAVGDRPGRGVEGPAQLDEVAQLERGLAGDRDERLAGGEELALGGVEDHRDGDAVDHDRPVHALGGAVEPDRGARAECSPGELDLAGEGTRHPTVKQQQRALYVGEVDGRVREADGHAGHADRRVGDGDELVQTGGARGPAVHDEVGVGVQVDVDERQPLAGGGHGATGVEAGPVVGVAAVVAVEPARGGGADDHVGVTVGVEVAEGDTGGGDGGGCGREGRLDERTGGERQRSPGCSRRRVRRWRRPRRRRRGRRR